MAYSPKGVMDIFDILTRWHAGYSIAGIAKAIGADRKTVRRYVREAESCGLSRAEPIPERDALLERLRAVVAEAPRHKPAQSVFEPYRAEVLELVTRTSDPLKPKTAYDVLCLRHGVKASYSTFKRFMRTLAPELSGRRTTCRFEVDPGAEIQLDYGKVGRIVDPSTGRQRDVYAFIGTLSHCRYKFVEFVYTQDQTSFVGSHTRMFAFFGGSARCLLVDNLKSGVVKADRYDPILNPLFRDMAAHFGTFVDTARVRSPKDKGKVERIVPLARELFRKLKTLHPDLDLGAANRMALDWCRHDNGMRVHGTTGEKPAEAFAERERTALIPLPEAPFQMATWKQVTVHPDQYIQFERKTYSLPTRFVSQKLWVRGTEKMVELYDAEFRLVKQYVRTARLRTTDPSDFPADVRELLGDHAVVRLIDRAGRVGPAMRTYIARILEPHAKVNFRKAQSMLGLADTFGADAANEAASFALAHRLFRYQDFKQLIDEASNACESAPEEEPIPISPATAEMLRSASYFIHPTHATT